MLANLQRWRDAFPERPELTADVRDALTRSAIVFLGGLGEIGRNCMAIEQDGKLLLIDCGLMFPDADMHGIDLVLPDFTWLRENADRIVGVRRHPRPRGPRRRAAVPAARAAASRSTARPSRSAWPATASRRPACSAAPS